MIKTPLLWQSIILIADLFLIGFLLFRHGFNKLPLVGSLLIKDPQQRQPLLIAALFKCSWIGTNCRKDERHFIPELQFHIEGFVNQYTLESISPDGKTIVFVTEAIENIPKGWRCRETYTLNEANELSEVFDMAEPGKEFELYTKASFRRLK